MHTGITVLCDGLFTSAQAATNWTVILGVAVVASFAWLARLESDQLDKAGTKPHVVRH